MKLSGQPIVKRIALFVAGGITALAFAPYYAFYILPFTLTLVFRGINRAENRKTAFGTAFWFAAGLGVCSTNWITNALMIDGGSFAYLIPLCWLGMGTLFGLFWAVPAVLCRFGRAGGQRLLAWTAIMVIFEWGRSWILTGFPWNLMGSVWENSLPILQSASVWGVYGLSFMTLTVGASPALWPNKKPVIAAGMALVILYGAGALRLYQASDSQAAGVRVRLVQPNIPQTLKWDPQEADANVDKLIRLSRDKNDAITHVIWPESAVPFIVNTDETERARLMQAVRQGGTLILGGMRATGNRQTPIANSLFILDDLANIVASYDKAHLVPFGEYVPMRGILGRTKIVPLPFDFEAGAHVRTIRTRRTPALGPLVCYEVIFSGQVVERGRRPDWLINITNDGWYGLSAGPYQHLGMAKMRAVEEGLPLARAANTGISAVFDGYGRTLGRLELGREGVLDTALPMPLARTIYAWGGVGIPLALMGGILLFLGIMRKKP